MTKNYKEKAYLNKQNNTIKQLLKPKTKHHPILFPDKYAYCEVLHMIANISNTTIQKKPKICKENKIIG